jgi:putative serine protease PepD
MPFVAGGYQAPAPAGYGAPPARQASRVVGRIGLGVVILLLVVAAVQTVLLIGVSSDLKKTRDDQSKSAALAAKQQEDLGNLTKRVQSLESRTAGSLNSTAVAKKVLPSVFSVRAGDATGTAFAFGRDTTGGTLLITNFHVVSDAVAKGATTATIERSSQNYPVTILRMDKTRDLVVLRSTTKFTALPESKTDVEPGDPIIVVGAPLGLDNTVTTGVVSAIRNDVQGLATRVIQFDAAINPGNSGGPVINANGQVVGIAQAKIVAENADGLGLAIPIDEVCQGLIAC